MSDVLLPPEQQGQRSRLLLPEHRGPVAAFNGASSVYIADFFHGTMTVEHRAHIETQIESVALRFTAGSALVGLSVGPTILVDNIPSPTLPRTLGGNQRLTWGRSVVLRAGEAMVMRLSRLGTGTVEVELLLELGTGLLDHTFAAALPGDPLTDARHR